MTWFKKLEKAEQAIVTDQYLDILNELRKRNDRISIITFYLEDIYFVARDKNFGFLYGSKDLNYWKSWWPKIFSDIDLSIKIDTFLYNFEEKYKIKEIL